MTDFTYSNRTAEVCGTSSQEQREPAESRTSSSEMCPFRGAASKDVTRNQAHFFGIGRALEFSLPSLALVLLLLRLCRHAGLTNRLRITTTTLEHAHNF